MRGQGRLLPLYVTLRGVSHPDTIADEMRCLLRHLGWILRGTHRRQFSGMKRFLAPREGGSLQDPPGEQLAIRRVLQPNLTRHDAITPLSPATVANYLSAEGPKNAGGEQTKAVLSHRTALGSLEGFASDAQTRGHTGGLRAASSSVSGIRFRECGMRRARRFLRDRRRYDLVDAKHAAQL